MADWSCLLYNVMTGAVTGELPLAQDPTWSRSLNSPGSMSVTTIVGAKGVPDVESLREIAAGMKYGIALVWNDSNWIVNLGPIVSSSYNDDSKTLDFGAKDTWGLLGRRLLVNSAWDGTKITSTTADINYTDTSLHDMAIGLVRHTLDYAGGGLAINTPATTGAGGNQRLYQGYDGVSVAQRLQELTQIELGPDVDFQGYFSAPGVIRINMIVGEPFILQPASSIVWDYGSGLKNLAVDIDSSDLSTRSTAKGSGTGYDLVTSTITDTSLSSLGWPLADFIDSSHSSVSLQTTIDQYASADIKLYRRPVEQWSAEVRTDVDPRPGQYQPGFYARFYVQGHSWIPDGSYYHRIMGFSNGTDGNTVSLTLQAVQGTV